ncbi:MAG: signal recognition particle subunit SRP19/SEC65 family protein [Desulfurococcaceae archaeon]
MRRDYEGKRIIFYPAYLDYNLSRKNGRRVPLSLAVPNPTLEEIVRAARVLGLDAEVEQNSLYPRHGRSGAKGRVIVSKRGSKLKTIYEIARALKEIRGVKR